MKKIWSLILPAVVALTFGCGKHDTYKTADGTVTVDQKGDTAKYEVTTKEGKATMTASDKGVAIPDTFPKDVPIPPGAVPKLTMTQGQAEMLHLHVAGTVADVAKDYQEKLKAAGWEIDTTMNMGDNALLSAKKEKRQCAALVVKEDSGVMIQLTVTKD